MSLITPCLWFDGNAEDAVRFYTSTFPHSTIDDIHQARADTPGGAAGSVLMISFTLGERKFLALNGGRHDAFNDAVSMSVDCADQTEVDRYWDALTAGGGRPVACGWLKDKFGLSWQIVPRQLPKLLANADPAVGQRVMQAMFQMVKLDIAALEAAAKG